MTTWITSDLHYFHKNILEYCKSTRQFGSVEDMNSYLLEYHNSNVGTDDTFIHVGDFAFGKGSNKQSIVDIVSQMNGRKQFILGNHDPYIVEISKDKALMQELNIDWILHYYQDKNFTLCHYPMHNWFNDRYGAVQLYGHLHDKYVDTKGTWNVGWDANSAEYITLEIAISKAKNH